MTDLSRRRSPSQLSRLKGLALCTFAEEAIVAARETPAAEAFVKANDIAAMRDQVGLYIGDALDARRRDARRGDPRTGLPEKREPEGGTRPGDANAPTADDVISNGRSSAATKSDAPPGAHENFNRASTTYLDEKGNIRVENLNVVEDVGLAIKEMSEENGGFLEARRGKLTDGETLAMAEDMGISPKHIDQWKVGQAFNAEQVKSARKMLVQAATDVRDKSCNGG